MNKIDQAKQDAIAKCILAYAPQPVKQPDGSTLHLCYKGRITRAYAKLGALRIALEQGKATKEEVKRVEGAVEALRKAMGETLDAADKAASFWVALSVAADKLVDAGDCYPPVCTCEGCKAEDIYQEEVAAQYRLTEAIYQLLAPNDQDTPPFLELMRKAGDEAARQTMWAYWKKIMDNAEAYIVACQHKNVRPNWRLILYPGEGG